MADVTETPHELRLHCALATLYAEHPDLAAGLARAAAVGFQGVEGAPPPLTDAPHFASALADQGLAFGAALYLPEHAEPEPWFERAAAAGALYLEAQVDGYWQEDDWIDGRTAQLMTLGERYGLPFYLETHRGRYTQDLRRTLALLERLPALQLCGDFSHFVVSGELKAPWAPSWKSALDRVAARCGMLHARMNAGQRVQDPLEAVPPEQRRAFLDLWGHAAQAAWRRGQAAFTITTELLPPDYQFLDGEGQRVGELWKDTVRLRQLIVEHDQDRASQAGIRG